MIQLARFGMLLRLICLLFAITSNWGFGQETSPPYAPPEMQAADPEVKKCLNSADKSGQEGNYPELLRQLLKAFDLSTKKGIVADKALIEARLGQVYAIQGKLEDSKQQWSNAFSDSLTTGNLVLQAEALVALSSMEQATGNLSEALDFVSKAVDLARKSKNLWIQSRCLGELGSLQISMGKSAEARASVEEALRIDRLNGYTWEATHLFYLAQVFAVDPSQSDQAIQLANSARELAIKQEDYLTFMQASAWLGQAYVGKGQVDDGITILERSRDGVSADGKPLFKNPAAYRAGMAEPFPRFVLLGAIAAAYKAGQRADDALKAWEELYEAARTAGFTLFTAGAAQEIAGNFQAKKDFAKAISYYSIAAEFWAKGGSTRRQIDALITETSLLSQQGQGDKALPIVEELLILAKSTKNVGLQFQVNLSMAEILQTRGDLDRAAQALKDAESLLPSDLALPNVEPRFVLELFGRECDLADKRRDPLQALIALEKAMLPAGNAQNVDAMTFLENQVKERLVEFDMQGKATRAYENGDLANALVYYELLQDFERTHAIWNGKSDEYFKHSSETVNILFDMPLKIVAKPDGAQVLQTNLEEMGPIIAHGVRLPILIALSNYYSFKQIPEMVTKYASAALPYLKLGEQDQPNSWDVALACELA